jgi:hypothetical protein
MPRLVDAMRRALLDARRHGDRAAAAALRSGLATLANAEAVPVAGDLPTVASEHVAGLGAGATETARRHVTDAEQVALLRAEITELETAAATYDRVDPVRAEGARAGARVLRQVLSGHEG